MSSNYFDGSVFKIIAKHSKKVFDIQAQMLEVDGGFLQQWQETGADSQRFVVLPVDDDKQFFAIVCIANGKVLDVSGVSNDDCARICQYRYANGDNQKFALEPVPDEDNTFEENTFYIRAKHSGKVLNVSGASQDNGAVVFQYGSTGDQENEKFIFEKVGPTLQCLIDTINAFIERNPKPDKPEYKINSSLVNALNAYQQESRGATIEGLYNYAAGQLVFYPHRLPFFRSFDITRWLQHAKSKASFSDVPVPEAWSLDDTLGVLSMAAFGIPLLGIPISGALDGASRAIRNWEARSEYFRNLREAKNPQQSEIQQVGDQLKEFITSESNKAKLDTIFARVIELRGLMVDMLPVTNDPYAPTEFGFNPTWVQTWRQKNEVLNEDNLGKVWLLVRSEEFDQFVHQSNALLDKIQQVSLIEKPTASMITVGSYCTIITVVVLAIELYAVVRLLPEAALRPGWAPPPPNDSQWWDEAFAADWDKYDKGESEPAISEISASYCYSFLVDRLNTQNSGNWLRRIDPRTGDAIGAYKKIVDRLNRISYGSNLPGYRDGLYFLPESKSIAAKPWSKKPSTVFKDQCTPSQSEVKDSALTATSSDDFIEQFKGFQTELKINWTYSSNFFDATSISARELNKSYGSFKSPWGGSSTYAQVSWGLDETQSYIDAIGWLGLVLLTYTGKFNYAIDLGNQVENKSMTTYDIACETHHTLKAKYDAIAETLRSVSQPVSQPSL